MTARSLAASVRRLKGLNLPPEMYEYELARLADIDPTPDASDADLAFAGIDQSKRMRELKKRIISLEERVRQLEIHS